MEFREMTAAEIGQTIKAGEMTAVDAVKAALAEIKRQDEVLNSFVTVDEEGALKRAAEVQKRIESGELTGPLAGVQPLAEDEHGPDEHHDGARGIDRPHDGDGKVLHAEIAEDPGRKDDDGFERHQPMGMERTGRRLQHRTFEPPESAFGREERRKEDE